MPRRRACVDAVARAAPVAVPAVAPAAVPCLGKANAMLATRPSTAVPTKARRSLIQALLDLGDAPRNGAATSPAAKAVNWLWAARVCPERSLRVLAAGPGKQSLTLALGQRAMAESELAARLDLEGAPECLTCRLEVAAALRRSGSGTPRASTVTGSAPCGRCSRAESSTSSPATTWPS